MGIRIAVIFFALTLAGCKHIEPGPEEVGAVYDLETVVEAVQYAIDESEAHSAWSATQKEKAHWDEVCKLASANEAKFCGGMRASAEEICEEKCDGTCSPVDVLFCEGLASGSLYAEQCASPSSDLVTGWCQDATQCLAVRKDKKRFCDARQAATLPKLKTAELTLKIEESQKGSGGVSLFVVEFGGSRARSSASTVTLELKPRVREQEYGGVEAPSDLKDREASEQVKALSGNLSELITSAVKAGTLEVVDNQGNAFKPPLALSGFKVVLALSVTKDGKLSIGKEWDSVPAKISLGSEDKESLTNTLTLTYSRE
ncbi:MAG: trypco2 family protein [Pseudomonadota bacterium]